MFCVIASYREGEKVQKIIVSEHYHKKDAVTHCLALHYDNLYKGNDLSVAHVLPVRLPESYIPVEDLKKEAPHDEA